MDEALALEEGVVRRDPVSLGALFNLGIFQRVTGRLDAAIASFRTVLSLVPGRGGAHLQLGTALLLKGDAQGALAEIEQETSEVWKMIGLPLAYYALGRKADSDAALAALIVKAEKDGPCNIASVYAYRGEADQAFAWLDKGIEYGDGGLGEIVSDNMFDNIHADPRWLPFLRKIGKAPEQLAKIEFKVTLPKEWQVEVARAAVAAPEAKLEQAVVPLRAQAPQRLARGRVLRGGRVDLYRKMRYCGCARNLEQGFARVRGAQPRSGRSAAGLAQDRRENAFRALRESQADFQHCRPGRPFLRVRHRRQQVSDRRRNSFQHPILVCASCFHACAVR
jgi:tetratricopeptide (TPR) repeat protein